MVNLSTLKPTQRGRIVSVACGEPHADRLLAMGVIPGSLVSVVGYAPLGDPMLVDVNGSRLSLRKREAAMLGIEQVGG